MEEGQTPYFGFRGQHNRQNWHRILHGDSSSYSPAALDIEREQRTVPALQSPVMSRRSLRLHTAAPFGDESLLDRSLPSSSASFSAGASGSQLARSVKSHRRSQLRSVSCSQSLLLSSQRQTSPPLHNSSLHSVASDASLLSSMLDESSVQDRTLVDSFWGLDQDVDPTESTLIAEPSAVPTNSTLIGQEDDLCSSHAAQGQNCTVNGFYCKDCDPHHTRKEAPSACYPSPRYTSSSSRYTSSSLAACPAGLGAGDSGPSTIYCRDKSRKSRTAHSRYCRVMNLKESGASKTQLNLNGSLWDAVGDAFRWLGRRWHHVFGSVSLHRGFVTRFLSGLLLLLPLLLLLSLCWWGPATLLSVLPAINMTEWRAALPLPHLPILSSLTSSQSEPEESRELQTHVEPPFPPLLVETAPRVEEEAGADSTRLLQLERRLAGLWERVEAGGRQAEQRHDKLLQMYQDLQQHLALPQSPGGGTEAWLSDLLDHRLTGLREQLDRQRLQWQQTQDQYLAQQQSQASRLAELELLLQTLAAKTEEVQRRQEATTAAAASPTTLPAPVSAGVDRESHDALLAEVVRLETALGNVRQDLQGLMGCRDRCERLDGVQKAISARVSAQVREEIRALFYGNQLTTGTEASGDPAAIPDSLLRWLSERYVSAADLQASLASLELSILQNISLQLQQSAERTACEETVRQSVLHAAQDAGAAVTEQDVHQIVQNALRLFSEDQTGMADYALESGGGSVLSTRCSETYETKTALMSLFGVPLWYFSQSPRVVIQPDVHPGNCWAFRGFKGYLVIRLSMKIVPTAFTLEHIPRALAPSGTLRSAPRDFTIYGLDDENQENGKLLGSYTYQEHGEPLQTFPVSEENSSAFQIIEVQVLSNWGHEVYTCMYRLRVHGRPSDD
ncbi:SUN domain-containing protein 1 isoform X3 [Myripristis murdjan]|uniref:SUN domain-containing protein 1 isoform X3 n=1 Tax=Myripristis murdjan TaxID=586833 RepID=UPI001175E6F0|nr:SUN domain-containing protein 1-like isoform X3 [Myripristis murdjan]